MSARFFVAGISGREPGRQLAHNMDTQCYAVKFYGRKKGTYQCQLEEDHPGWHVDCIGREWRAVRPELRYKRRRRSP